MPSNELLSLKYPKCGVLKVIKQCIFSYRFSKYFKDALAIKPPIEKPMKVIFSTQLT